MNLKWISRAAFFLETLEDNAFPWRSHLLETTCVPHLLAPSSISEPTM